MLTLLRKLSETWIFKGILALTALSFISLFGVGSLSNLKRGGNIAVGTSDYDMTKDEFARQFNREILRLNKITGKSISYNEAVERGMYMPLLISKSYDFTFASLNKELNIDISPINLGMVIKTQPIFLNQNGEFSKELYNYYLSSMDTSESEFEVKMANDIKNRFVSAPLKDTVKVPEVLVENIYKFQNEKRDGKYFEIKASDMKITKQPTEEDLKSYYEGFEEKFMAPEYRASTVMFVSSDKIKDSITVTDEEVTERFEEIKGNFVVPEKRQIEQILVQDEEAANKIIEALKKEKDFIKVAKEMASQSKEDTDFGLVTADSLVPEIADITFDAKKGEIVGPVETYLGFHVLKVVDIIPGKTPELSAKKKDIIDLLKNEKISDVMSDILLKIDDAFGVGKTLEETAKEIGAEVIAMKKVDITGVDEKGTKYDAPFMNDEFLSHLYAGDMEVGQVSVTMETEQGLAVLRLDSVEVPALKEFALVKDELKKVWSEDEKQSMLENKKAEIEKEIDAGKDFKSVSSGNKVFDVKSVGRIVNEKNYPMEVVDTMFKIDENNGILSSRTNDGYVFVSLDKIIPANKSNEDISVSQVKDDLQDELSESLYSEFLNVLGARYNLQVNNKIVEEALRESKNLN